MRSILLSAVTVLLTLYSFGITQFCSPAATVHSCMFGNGEAYIGEEKVSVSLKNEKKRLWSLLNCRVQGRPPTPLPQPFWLLVPTIVCMSLSGQLSLYIPMHGQYILYKSLYIQFLRDNQCPADFSHQQNTEWREHITNYISYSYLNINRLYGDYYVWKKRHGHIYI